MTADRPSAGKPPNEFAGPDSCGGGLESRAPGSEARRALRAAGAEPCLAAQAEGSTGTAVRFGAAEVVPAHLLDGGEIVHFAIKPSAWFILLDSSRWLAASLAVAVLAATEVISSGYQLLALRAAVLLAAVGLGWATLEWVSRLYVLTNRRVMSIRGVVRVEMFECFLRRIHDARLAVSPPQRLFRVGTVLIRVGMESGAAPSASWRHVARPADVHQKLCDAISRARNRGDNGC
jgi:hypothetical protein